jgi:undecaprenyl phosphate-alpha-L-ara4N flippase subunit ArnE
MFLSSLCVCGGQLFWKLCAGGENLLELFIGFGLYGLGSCMMLAAYKFGKLSVLQPILSLNYVFAVLLGHLVFGEPFTVRKIVGIAIIGAGVMLLKKGDED